MFDLQVGAGRATLLLCRAPVNAINVDWLAGFHAVLDRLEAGPEFSVLHIRSSEKVFCAGMDLDRVRRLFAQPDGAAAMVRDVAEFQRLFARIEALPQVVVAEIGGAALGGGLELALACDLRIASRKAKLGLPETRLGLIPGAGGTQRLTWLCGRGAAARIILSADVIDGAQAERLGLVQWVSEPEALADTAEAVVARIAGLSRAAVREAKQLIAAAGDPARDGFAEEREADRRLFDETETKTRVGDFLAGVR